MSQNPTIEPNAEAIEAWNTVLYDKFLQFRELLIANLTVHGDRGIDRLAPAAGDRVVDLGCGWGDTTVELARRVGPTGHALGVDAARRFIDAARSHAGGIANVSFDVADVQAGVPGGPFDLAYSRMGMMFFASPVIALRNVRRSLRSGGRFCMIVWRNKAAQEGFALTERAVRELVGNPDKGDHVTCGPGPFSMANTDVVSDQMRAAGFVDITFARSDAPMKLGKDLDAAVELALTLGPAGEVLRLAGDAAVARHAEVDAAARAVLAPFVRPDGTWVDGSAWIVTATAP